MSSAQLEPRPQYLDEFESELLPPELPSPAASDFAAEDSTQPVARPDTSALKQQVAARLAEHRARRQRNAAAAPARGPIAVETPARAAKRAAAARISATVAERYAHTESYRSFLAAKAETVIEQAVAVAKAQLDLLEELDQFAATQQNELATASANVESVVENPRSTSTSNQLPTDPLGNQQVPANQPAHLTVRLFEPAAAAVPSGPHTTSHLPAALDPLDAEALDEEIAFRQAPVFEPSLPITEIPANLIEFPRQLIAARRARPRLAEGPLREDGDPAAAAQSPAQLRIFEVEPTQLSSAPAVSSAAPEWTSIMLDAHPHSHLSQPHSMQGEILAPLHYTESDAAQLYIPLDAAAAPLQTAPLELRIMAAAVDTSIVLATLLAFTAAVGFAIGPIRAIDLKPLFGAAGFQIGNLSATFSGLYASLSELIPIAVIAIGAFLALTVLYQVLFFTFSDATPGMQYARIGLCTFSDENPTRAQMRRRSLAFFLSACPLGLGLMWSWIDTDRLGWHDRLSRMYQRSY